MTSSEPASTDIHPRGNIRVEGVNISYIDTGDLEGRPIVFLHGNPTSSYLWRNVIPHVIRSGRCLAPDLVGMGRSGSTPDGQYGFADHARYLDGWFQSLRINNAVLVVHDWGSALGFHWAHRNADKISGLVYMEALVQPLEWDAWPEQARGIFQAMRSDAGEEMVLAKNVFVDKILPASVLRRLTEEEMLVYRRPFLRPGESRRPTLTWPRQIPVGGEPKDVVSIVDTYGRWMCNNDIPKLFINGDPGSILVGKQREFCRGWRNQNEITVKGLHFIQEDSPDEIGIAIRDFCNALQ